MRKKVNLIFATIVFAVVGVFLVEGAEGFCVYNQTDTKIMVTQVAGGIFGKIVDPGEKVCCHYEDRRCNEGGKMDSIVTFNVGKQESTWYKSVCLDFSIKAGGWLLIEKIDGKYMCGSIPPDSVMGK